MFVALKNDAWLNKVCKFTQNSPLSNEQTKDIKFPVTIASNLIIEDLRQYVISLLIYFTRYLIMIKSALHYYKTQRKKIWFTFSWKNCIHWMKYRRKKQIARAEKVMTRWI